MYALAERLKIHRLMAIGLMESLWHMAAKNAPHGDIGRYSDTAIAELCGWPKKPKDLIEALVDVGWIDRNDKHRLVIHDWPEHCENAVHSLLAKRGESFWDGTPTFDRKSRKVGELFTPTREAKAKAEAKASLGSSFSLEKSAEENLSFSRADAKSDALIISQKSASKDLRELADKVNESLVARSDWAERMYFEHPKQTNKHYAIPELCKIYDCEEDKSLYEMHHGAWGDYWARDEVKFCPPLMKQDGTGFLPDGGWRKPPPKPPRKKNGYMNESMRGLAELREQDEREEQA